MARHLHIIPLVAAMSLTSGCAWFKTTFGSAFSSLSPTAAADADLEEGKKEIDGFTASSVDADSDAMRNYWERFEDAHRRCRSMYGEHKERGLMTEDAIEAAVKSCREPIHARMWENWTAAAEGLYTAGESYDYHWALRRPLRWMSQDYWFGPKEAPVAQLEKASALRVGELNDLYAKRKAYVDLNGADCVVTTTKPKSSGRLELDFHVEADDDVYVRCFYAGGVNANVAALTDVRAFGRVFVQSDTDWKETYEVPIDVRAFLGKPYVDFAFSLDRYASGASFGQVEAYVIFEYTERYEDTWDEYQQAFVRKPIRAEQYNFTALSFSG